MQKSQFFLRCNFHSFKAAFAVPTFLAALSSGLYLRSILKRVKAAFLSRVLVKRFRAGGTLSL